METRIIKGLTCFFCTTYTCWLTPLGCTTNQETAKQVIDHVKQGYPIWAVEQHMVKRAMDCPKCERFKADNKELIDGIEKEVKRLTEELEEKYEAGDDYERRCEQKRRWWRENKGVNAINKEDK